MAEIFDESVICTLEQAAELLSTTAMSVLMHLKHRLIVGIEVNGQWYVNLESLNAYRLQHPQSHKTLCKKHSCQHSACHSCS